MKKAEKEGKEHRGLKKIEPDNNKADKHIEKAQHKIEQENRELIFRLLSL